MLVSKHLRKTLHRSKKVLFSASLGTTVKVQERTFELKERPVTAKAVPLLHVKYSVARGTWEPVTVNSLRGNYFQTAEEDGEM